MLTRKIIIRAVSGLVLASIALAAYTDNLAAPHFQPEPAASSLLGPRDLSAEVQAAPADPEAHAAMPRVRVRRGQSEEAAHTIAMPRVRFRRGQDQGAAATVVHAAKSRASMQSLQSDE